MASHPLPRFVPRSLLPLIPPQVATMLAGMAAYGSAEVANRVVRVFAIIVVARRIDAAAMGAAALALSLFELIRVLANAGIGQRVVAAEDDELGAVCNRAYRLAWWWCSIVAVIQLAVAATLWLGFGQGLPAAMLAVLATVYLTMPPGLVGVFLMMREGRLGATARIGATQTMADHALTMALALLMPSAWAIVLPKLLTAPIWTFGVRRARRWRGDAAHGLAPTRSFVNYGAGVLAGELGNAARAQLGNLVIGAMLGTQALGLYFFAVNAGLGITSSFVAAFTTVLFPQLCAARDEAERRRRYRHGVVLGLALFLPVTLAQVTLAPIYVPLLFSARWASAAPLVSLLGLAALPLVAAAATTAWLRATRRTSTDAVISLVACAAAVAGLAIGATRDLSGAAIGYVVGLALVLVPVSLHLFLSTRETTR